MDDIATAPLMRIADMRPPGNPAGGRISERHQTGDELHDEPDHRERQRADLKEQRDDQDRHDHDQPRRRKHPRIAPDHSRDRA